MNKIEFFEGDSWAIALKIDGIDTSDIEEISVVLSIPLTDLYKQYSKTEGTLIKDNFDDKVWYFLIDDQTSRFKSGFGKWQINLKTEALGWKHSEVFQLEIKKSVNVQSENAATNTTIINQLFEVEFSTGMIVNSAMLYNLFRGPSAYEIAVFHGFVGTEEDWNNEVNANVLAASNSANLAQTAATSAANSATSAATSASTANTKATEAATSATNAANSATSAATAASTANTKATEATTSATNAANSADQAQTAATSSANSADQAQNAAIQSIVMAIIMS